MIQYQMREKIKNIRLIYVYWNTYKSPRIQNKSFKNTERNNARNDGKKVYR